MNTLRSRGLLAITSVALLAAGCASVPEDSGFSTVSSTVADRLDKHISWQPSAQIDEATQAKIDALLDQPLTADSAVQLALHNSPHLQSIYEELGLAAANLSQAGRPENPLIGGKWLDPRDGMPSARDFDISFNILDLVLIPLRVEAAEQELEATKLTVSSQVLDYAAKVRKAFYEMQAAVHREGMFDEVASSAEASFDTAQRLRKIGNISALSFNRYRFAHEDAKLMLADAKLAVLDRREALNALMGIRARQTDWSVGEGLGPIPNDPVDVSNLAQRAIDASLDLQALKHRITALGERHDVSNIQSVLEDLEIGYTWDEESSGEWKDGPLVEFKIPLFDQGQGRRSMAVSMLNRTRADYLNQRIHIGSQARSLAARLNQTRAKLDVMIEAMLPLSRDLFQQMLREYNAMQMDVFRLLRAYDEQVRMRQRFVDTLRDYWLLRADLTTLLSGRSINMAATGSPAMAAGNDDGGH